VLSEYDLSIRCFGKVRVLLIAITSIPNPSIVSKNNNTAESKVMFTSVLN
jgi:hypothetical protein